MKKPQKKRTFPHRSQRWRENFNLLAVSVGLAVAVWLFAKLSESEEAGLTIPVVVTPEDPRIEIRVSPSQMPVILRYPKELRNYITSENFRFSVDISDLRDQLGLDWLSKTEPMNEKNLVAKIRGARRVTLVKVGAPTNTVRVEARWKAEPAVIVPDLVGTDKLPSGYQLVPPVRVDPPEVWVTGRPEILFAVPRDAETSKIKILTNRIDIAGRTQGGLMTVPLRVPPGLEIIHPKTTTAEVSIEIQEIQTVRELRGVKINLSAVAPESVSVEYDRKDCTVTLFGPQSLLPKVTPDMIEVSFVRPAEEIPGTTREVGLEAHFSANTPEDIRSKLTIRTVEPKTIQVRYVAKQPPEKK
ncbi:MAG: hypothetical protein ACP5QZ_04415 [Candidatus Sumerlaeaceae bacterium]